MKEPFILDKNDHSILQIWANQFPQICAGFTTKNGGFSTSHFSSLNVGLHVDDVVEHVLSNRKKVAEALHLPLENWVCADQTHGDNIAKIDFSMKGNGAFSYQEAITSTDGMYTFEKNLMLVLCFADCVPLYFYSPEDHLVGVAHAGWKGTVKNIAGKMISIWNKQEKIKLNNIYVAIGPSIGSCCYIVDEYVINQVNHVLPNKNIKPYDQISIDQYRLDLKLLNKILLLNAGISPENILMSSYCTSCESPLFFSHRRDKGKTGRMMSYIALKEV